VLVRGARTGCYVDGAGRGRPRPPAPPARFYRSHAAVARRRAAPAAPGRETRRPASGAV